jgi:hypothetical protein
MFLLNTWEDVSVFLYYLLLFFLRYVRKYAFLVVGFIRQVHGRY